jgi:hypothetical protein
MVTGKCRRSVLSDARHTQAVTMQLVGPFLAACVMAFIATPALAASLRSLKAAVTVETIEGARLHYLPVICCTVSVIPTKSFFEPAQNVFRIAYPTCMPFFYHTTGARVYTRHRQRAIAALNAANTPSITHARLLPLQATCTSS